MLLSIQVSSLPYRTVGNALLATSITWAAIAASSVPIWFAHHLQQLKRNKNETMQNGTSVIKVHKSMANIRN